MRRAAPRTTSCRSATACGARARGCARRSGVSAGVSVGRVSWAGRGCQWELGARPRGSPELRLRAAAAGVARPAHDVDAGSDGRVCLGATAVAASDAAVGGGADDQRLVTALEGAGVAPVRAGALPVQAFSSSIFRDNSRCDTGESQSKWTVKDGNAWRTEGGACPALPGRCRRAVGAGGAAPR
jgi:hypothetical protein